MHYYKFNIGDFDKITRHLSIVERGIFRDLLDLYIKDEQPIISDLKKLERLLCIKTKSEKIALANVLDDFFELIDEGFYSEFCQAILNDTTDRADASRENGKKGGRPSKASTKQTESQSLANQNQDESQNKANDNLEKTYQKPSNNLDESHPRPITQDPLPNNNSLSNAHEQKTADEVLAQAQQVKQANAQDIQNWVVPSLDEIRSMLFGAGFSGALNQKDYDRHVSDFKIFYEAQALEGKNLATDSLRKNKLRDWIMLDAQKNAKPSYQKKSQQFGSANDPLNVNQNWRPGETGIVEANTVFDFTGSEA